MHKTPWLVRKAGTHRRLRLYCFSYAGGNASAYTGWQDQLDPGIEICAVQLPGRGSRLGEAPIDNMQKLVKELAAVVAHQGKMPFAFFGHSLGGLVSFELARYCKLHYLPQPLHLIVSGCNAPQHRGPSRGLHKLPHDELVKELLDYNGTPREVLEHRELMEMLLPTIRADFSLAEEYRYSPGLQLEMPVTALAGLQDKDGAVEPMQGWDKESKGAFALHWFEGGHFFINSAREEVLACIDRALAPLLAAHRPAYG